MIERKFCELVSAFVMYCLEHAMCQDEFGLCVNDGLHKLSTSGPEMDEKLNEIIHTFKGHHKIIPKANIEWLYKNSQSVHPPTFLTQISTKHHKLP